jgi:hypothetical protein
MLATLALCNDSASACRVRSPIKGGIVRKLQTELLEQFEAAGQWKGPVLRAYPRTSREPRSDETGPDARRSDDCDFDSLIVEELRRRRWPRIVRTRRETGGSADACVVTLLRLNCRSRHRRLSLPSTEPRRFRGHGRFSDRL